MKQCECCGRPLPDNSVKAIPMGPTIVQMGPVMQRIFNLLWEASPRGMTSEKIRDHVYAMSFDGGLSRNAISSIICRMNARYLRPRGLEVRSEIGRGRSWYTIQRVDA